MVHALVLPDAHSGPTPAAAFLGQSLSLMCWARASLIGIRVKVIGFRAWGLWFRVIGFGTNMHRVQGSGFRVQGSGFRVQGSGFTVQGSGFRVQGSGSSFRHLEVIGSRVKGHHRDSMDVNGVCGL